MQQKKEEIKKIPKWKLQSLQLRQGMIKKGTGNNNKAKVSYELTKEEQQMLKQSEEEQTIKCDYCGRRFNMTAGPRHIKFCETKAKDLHKNKPKAAPVKKRY